ncbi:MAG TPA: hypothetical protein VN880_02305 [Solirubrobacteraceae bacterium]|nr:hypothetical protein [Solirubrobacteraceae bacterium]
MSLLATRSREPQPAKVIEREHLRFVAHVPAEVNLKVEFEIDDDGTELEIELTW